MYLYLSFFSADLSMAVRNYGYLQMVPTRMITYDDNNEISSIIYLRSLIAAGSEDQTFF